MSTHYIWNPESKNFPILTPTPAPEVGEPRLRLVLEMIASEPCRSIRELAREVSLSPAHLQRLFKQHLGTPLGKIMAERRLSKAAALLNSTRLSIKEIAHAAGYQHHSSFVRAFQRRYMEAPKRFRSRSKNASER